MKINLADLAKKPKVHRVMGADISTNSFAFCLYTDDGPAEWGEVVFKGNTVFERLVDGQRKVRSLLKDSKYDVVAIEAIVYVNNRSTVINLAYIAGAMLACLNKPCIVEYNPLEWQRFIGNPPLTKTEKQAIVNKTPNKSRTWYQNENRRFRKDRTRQWVLQKYGILIQSDNVTDAFGVAFTGWSKLNGKDASG